MYIKNLFLDNFRNYGLEEFEFSPSVNVLYGNNAQGKTNCVESVFYLCTGYSPRARKEKQFIRYGEEKSKIKAVAETRVGTVSVEANFYSGEDKVIFVNGTEIKKIGEILGNINAVYFNPSELKLVTEAPEDRRRFIDISVSQIKRSYFYGLQRYKKIIAQRNNLLKNENKDLINATLAIWDTQLVPVCARIISDRNDFLKRLAPKAKEVHFYLTDGKEELEVGFDHSYEGSEKEIADAFLAELTERREKDMELGYTSIGPHRDDLKLMINGKDVKTYASQGQMRTTALSLKIAETEIFKERYGESPVLILDDALSELDKKRQKKLLERIKGVQTIITCTDVDEEVMGTVDSTRFLIDGGRLVEKRQFEKRV